MDTESSDCPTSVVKWLPVISFNMFARYLDMTVEAAESNSFSITYNKYNIFKFYDDHLCPINQACGEAINIETIWVIEEDPSNSIMMTA